MTTAELPVNKLNLPGISNLESENAFYVVGESDNSFSLVVFQVTVGKSRPVKVNGLCDILKAFPTNVVSNIKHKVLVFVFPLYGSLDGKQKLITKKGQDAGVLPYIGDFEQYLYLPSPNLDDGTSLLPQPCCLWLSFPVDGIKK